MDWRPFNTAPETGTFLVYLEKPLAGSYVHVMRITKLATGGKLAIIGSNFAFDSPPPRLWATIEPPTDVCPDCLKPTFTVMSEASEHPRIIDAHVCETTT